MFGRATIRLGIGPHSRYICTDERPSHYITSIAFTRNTAPLKLFNFIYIYNFVCYFLYKYSWENMFCCDRQLADVLIMLPLR